MRFFVPLVLIVALVLLAGGDGSSEAAPTHARNVILLIGDGMGSEQVRAAGLYRYGGEGTLAFERLPYHATVLTDSMAASAPTDSAAAATAIATGKKVNNGVIAMDIPRTGKPLTTIAESFKADGRAVGVVTTDGIVGATTAAFIAHVPLRKMYPKIAKQMLETSQPDVMLGARDRVLPTPAVEAAGYAVAERADELDAAVEEAATNDKRLAGLFPGGVFPYRYLDRGEKTPKYGSVYPQLADMTSAALRVLRQRGGDRGFFLVIESALIDKSGHSNRLRANSEDRIAVNVDETVALHEATEVALAFARRNPGTLVIVTSDHETGGLIVDEPRGQGRSPRVRWSHLKHSRTPVDAYATGFGAEAVTGTMENTELYHVMMRAAGLAPAGSPPASP